MLHKYKKQTALLLAVTMCMTATPVYAAVAKTPTLSKTNVTVKVGHTVTLKVKNAGKWKVTWKTSNKKVATVTQKGVVKGKKQGKAVITAQLKKGKNSKLLKSNVTVQKVKIVNKKYVSTQEEMEAALKKIAYRNLVIKTDNAGSFEIPEGDYKKIGLIVKAPNCTVRNAGVFKKISLCQVADSGWSEDVSGNVFVTTEDTLNFNISPECTVKLIKMKEGVKTALINNMGAVNGVSNMAAGNIVTLSGSGIYNKVVTNNKCSILDNRSGTQQATKVELRAGSEGTDAAFAHPVTMKIAADANVTFDEGAESSSVEVTQKDRVDIKVTNNTTAGISVTHPDGVVDVGSGYFFWLHETDENGVVTEVQPVEGEDKPPVVEKPETPTGADGLEKLVKMSNGTRSIDNPKTILDAVIDETTLKIETERENLEVTWKTEEGATLAKGNEFKVTNEVAGQKVVCNITDTTNEYKPIQYTTSKVTARYASNDEYSMSYQSATSNTEQQIIEMLPKELSVYNKARTYTEKLKLVWSCSNAGSNPRTYTANFIGGENWLELNKATLTAQVTMQNDNLEYTIAIPNESQLQVAGYQKNNAQEVKANLNYYTLGLSARTPALDTFNINGIDSTWVPLEITANCSVLQCSEESGRIAVVNSQEKYVPIIQAGQVKQVLWVNLVELKKVGNTNINLTGDGKKNSKIQLTFQELAETITSVKKINDFTAIKFGVPTNIEDMQLTLTESATEVSGVTDKGTVVRVKASNFTLSDFKEDSTHKVVFNPANPAAGAYALDAKITVANETDAKSYIIGAGVGKRCRDIVVQQGDVAFYIKPEAEILLDKGTLFSRNKLHMEDFEFEPAMDGSLSWDPAIANKAVTGDGSVDVVFTPKDTNYKEAKLQITYTARAAITIRRVDNGTGNMQITVTGSAIAADLGKYYNVTDSQGNKVAGHFEWEIPDPKFTAMAKEFALVFKPDDYRHYMEAVVNADISLGYSG